MNSSSNNFVLFPTITVILFDFNMLIFIPFTRIYVYYICVITLLTDISIRVSSLFTLVPLAPSTGVAHLTLCTGVRAVGVITGHVVKVRTRRGVAILTDLNYTKNMQIRIHVQNSC